jgi:dephospho-CoA kinase
MNGKLIITFVGMPGSGKSEAVKYLEQKNIPFVRFGQLTDEGVKELGLPLNEENERMVREKLRKDLVMAAYAIKSKPKIDALLEKNGIVAIDGLYSWEEYVFLQKEYPTLVLVHVFSERLKRYQRLTKRPIRPVPLDECYSRDVAEVENLNKAGPIALADYLIQNNGDSLSDLHTQIDKILERLEVR